jgi:transcriptional repressor NrdR
MVCTYCGAETQVRNSRHQKHTNTVWRRRKCCKCHKIFTTIEQVDYEKAWIVFYPADRQAPFIRDKLLISLHKSLQHRPTALSDAQGLTATIIGTLQLQHQTSIVTATVIATLCLGTLQRFDRAAATMYQVYHADVL